MLLAYGWTSRMAQLSPLDISLSLQPLDGAKGSRIVGIAYLDSTSDGIRLCRGFVHEGDRLLTTALVDPNLPGSRAEQQFAILSKRGTHETPQCRCERALQCAAPSPIS